MSSATLWTSPLTDRKVASFSISITTTRTQLRGREKCWYFYQLPTVRSHFIFEQRKEVTPRCIRGCFCQVMVFEHTIDVKTFDTDYLVFISQCERLFVQEVVTDIGNSLVFPCKSQRRFAVVSRAILFASQSAIQAFKFSLMLIESLWTIHNIGVGISIEMADADIDSNHSTAIAQHLERLFNLKRNKILTACGLGYSGKLDFATEITAVGKLNPTDFRESNSISVNAYTIVLAHSAVRLMPTLPFERRIATTF